MVAVYALSLVLSLWITLAAAFPFEGGDDSDIAASFPFGGGDDSEILAGILNKLEIGSVGAESSFGMTETGTDGSSFENIGQSFNTMPELDLSSFNIDISVGEDDQVEQDLQIDGGLPTKPMVDPYKPGAPIPVTTANAGLGFAIKAIGREDSNDEDCLRKCQLDTSCVYALYCEKPSSNDQPIFQEPSTINVEAISGAVLQGPPIIIGVSGYCHMYVKGVATDSMETTIDEEHWGKNCKSAVYNPKCRDPFPVSSKWVEDRTEWTPDGIHKTYTCVTPDKYKKKTPDALEATCDSSGVTTTIDNSCILRERTAANETTYKKSPIPMKEIDTDSFTIDLNGGATDPTGGATDPTGGATDPTGGATDPTGGATDPTGGATDPTGGATDPTGGATDPTGGATDPSGGSWDPTDASGGATGGSGGAAEIENIANVNLEANFQEKEEKKNFFNCPPNTINIKSRAEARKTAWVSSNTCRYFDDQYYEEWKQSTPFFHCFASDYELSGLDTAFDSINGSVEDVSREGKECGDLCGDWTLVFQEKFPQFVSEAATLTCYYYSSVTDNDYYYNMEKILDFNDVYSTNYPIPFFKEV